MTNSVTPHRSEMSEFIDIIHAKLILYNEIFKRWGSPELPGSFTGLMTPTFCRRFFARNTV